jgi:pimeloyl-ACP methyl ester carboxylesterase
MENGGRVAAAELDRDKERTFSIVLRGADEPAGALGSSGNVRMRGGLLEGLPTHVVPGKLFAEPGVLQEYVRGYERGFWGSLQLYNNYPDNTAFRGETRNVALRIPCLMITAGRDPILKPSHSAHMEKLIPHLTRAHVPDSSHWIMEEYPQEVNAALAAFYASLQSPRANM